jgi:nucleotide-binding universal stress UspA family protein
MKSILVLTDFSAARIAAAESALAIAAKLGGDILLLNVYPITPCLPPAGLTLPPQTIVLMKKQKSITGALEKLITEKLADNIALCYRRHPFCYRLFHENPLKEVIDPEKTPLLIYSENTVLHV